VFEETSARPLYLLAQPPMLESPGDLPHIAGPLTLLQGPERIDFGWWDDGEVSRDYFVARHACGALYWVYRQLSNNQWYLHGIFS
jgi:protein ImuB